MIAAAPTLKKELTVLMIAAATPLKTSPASQGAVYRSKKVGVASSPFANGGMSPRRTAALIATPTPK